MVSPVHRTEEEIESRLSPCGSGSEIEGEFNRAAPGEPAVKYALGVSRRRPGESAPGAKTFSAFSASPPKLPSSSGRASHVHSAEDEGAGGATPQSGGRYEVAYRTIRSPGLSRTGRPLNV